MKKRGFTDKLYIVNLIMVILVTLYSCIAIMLEENSNISFEAIDFIKKCFISSLLQNSFASLSMGNIYSSVSLTLNGLKNVIVSLLFQVDYLI